MPVRPFPCKTGLDDIRHGSGKNLLEQFPKHTVLLSGKSFNQTDVGKVMGNSVSDPLTGQVTFIFTGSSSLKINSIAFNAIIA